MYELWLVVNEWSSRRRQEGRGAHPRHPRWTPRQAHLTGGGRGLSLLFFLLSPPPQAIVSHKAFKFVLVLFVCGTRHGQLRQVGPDVPSSRSDRQILSHLWRVASTFFACCPSRSTWHRTSSLTRTNHKCSLGKHCGTGSRPLCTLGRPRGCGDQILTGRAPPVQIARGGSVRTHRCRAPRRRTRGTRPHRVETRDARRAAVRA